MSSISSGSNFKKISIINWVIYSLHSTDFNMEKNWLIISIGFFLFYIKYYTFHKVPKRKEYKRKNQLLASWFSNVNICYKSSFEKLSKLNIILLHFSSFNNKFIFLYLLFIILTYTYKIKRERTAKILVEKNKNRLNAIYFYNKNLYTIIENIILISFLDLYCIKGTITHFRTV